MRPGLLVVAFLVVAAIAATGSAWVANMARQASGSQRVAAVSEQAANVPLGDSATGHADNRANLIDNPFANDPSALAEGGKLFKQMNCAGCHGYDAKGGMGPDLTDAYWRYGGKAADIYKSIADGRPQGMPTWGHTLPERQIWQLTAYVQSLGTTSASASTPTGGNETGQNRGGSK